jgi:single-stranded DNA-specific DHH superfamily exonuclease
MKRTVRPAVDFVAKLEPKRRVVIIHDDDPDGICSAVLLAKACLRVVSENPTVHSTEYGQSLTPKLLKMLRRDGAQAIIFTDVPAIPRDLLSEAAEEADILILDHHYPDYYQKVVYANPRLLKPSAYLPSSYLAFHVARALGLPQDLCWIAGIGVLSDHGVDNCKPLFTLIKSEFPEIVGKARLEDASLMDKSQMGVLTKTISSAIVASPREGARVAFNALYSAETYRDILEGSSLEAQRLREWEKVVDDEFQNVIRDARRNVVRCGGKVVVYRFQSRLRIKSLVANYLPRLFKDNIVLVIQKDGKYTHVSLRRGDRNRTDLRSLVQRAIVGIPDASGGGHPEASAARLPSVWVDQFMDRIAQLT